MKRIFSTMLLFTVLFSCMTALASTPLEEYEAAWNAKYTSGTLDYSISTSLDQPLPAALDADGKITEILKDFNVTYSMTYQTNETQNAMKAYMQVSMNSLTAEMPNIKADTWIDLDLTDESNLKYNVIMKYIEPADMPGMPAGKYIIMDYAKLPGMMDMLKSMKTSGLFDISKAQELQKALMTGLDNIDPTYADGKYSLVLDEQTTKTALKTLIGNYYDLIFKNMMQPGSPLFASLGIQQTLSDEDVKTQIDSFFEKAAGVQIFEPKNAIEMETTLGDDKLLKNVKYKINLNTNIAKLVSAFGIPNVPATITEENSALNGSLVFDLSYGQINQPVSIDFPELTADNSVDMLTMMQTAADTYSKGITVLYNGNKIEYATTPVKTESTVLLPLRETLNALGVADGDIQYEDGVITISTPDKSVWFSIDSNTAYVNDEETAFAETAQLIDDRTFVDLSFFKDVLGFACNSSSADENTADFSIVINFTN